MNASLQEALRIACAEVGIVYKPVPVDGRWHETDVDDDWRGRGDARIKLFHDGEGGHVWNWKGVDKVFFVANGHEWTPAERAAHEKRRQESIRQRQEDDARRNAEAATKAATIWKAASLAGEDHPYLARKGIQAHGAKVGADGWLLVPMRDTAGKLWNLERIAPEKPADGSTDKKGLFGGRRTGCYFSIGNPKGAVALCICEGFATGASIHEATGYPVAVAFNAGNLGPVAKTLRQKFPALPLILCADDDMATDGNPGMTKATEAARAVGGVLAVPDFGRADV